MKVIVTGAAGFIGFHVVNALCAQGHDVIGLDNLNDYYDVDLKFARLKEAGIGRDSIVAKGMVNSIKLINYRFVKADILDLEYLAQLFQNENFDKVVHLAAQAGVRYSIQNPHVYVQANIVGFLNILECCRHHQIKHLIYASSSSVYGNAIKTPFSEQDRTDQPISFYAATKKSNELMAYTYSHLYELPTTGLRFFTVYGPWGRPDMAPFLFADAIDKGEAICVFNYGKVERDFTFISDIVDGVLSVVHVNESEKKGAVYNIGNGQPVNVLKFVEALGVSMGRIVDKAFLPMQPGDVTTTYADTSSLFRFTGYAPRVSLEEGVESFVKWFRAYRCS